MTKPLRDRIALMLLVLFALGSSVYQLWNSLELDEAGFRSNAAITEYCTQRFEQLEVRVPHNATLGYVEDKASDPQIAVKLYLAQYALAPRVLVSGTEHPLILGNFNDPQMVSRYATDKLTLIEDFGDGVCLYRLGIGK